MPTASWPDSHVAEQPARTTVATSHIRGSSILLVGRFIALSMKLVAHVLIVRYFARGDYGAFAYGLAIAQLGQGVALLGLTKTVGRFAPIYEERGDDARLFGTLILGFGTVLGIALTIVALFYALHGVLVGSLIQDQQAANLLLLLILLVPVYALDSKFAALFAIFAHARAIFVRRHLVSPALELGVVVLVIAAQLDLFSLALGYVAVGLFGIGLYSVLLVRVLAEKGLLDRLRRVRPMLPTREIFGFTLPLVSSDVVLHLRTSLPAVFLEGLRSTADVAALRAVMPLTRQNGVVQENFAFMFTPSAARLYARTDHAAINDLYWRTTVWIAVLTFPIFLLTFSLAQPITVLLFGQQYADAGIVTAILALGVYIHAIFGFNGLLLRVFGRVRYMVTADLATAGLGLLAMVVLINALGAPGAALATSGLLLGQSAAYHIGLARQTPVEAFNRRYGPTFVQLAAIALSLLVIEALTGVGLLVLLPLAGLTSLAVIRLNSGLLEVRTTFPELLRLPLVGRLLA
jgi:O-antigen/teichoic acid export membrane protein